MEERLTEKQNSIKVTKGMNDNYSWEIKIYFDEEEPVKKIKEIDDTLKEQFKVSKSLKTQKA